MPFMTSFLPPLIPAALLAKADKILFIGHLALGDYTYLQNCFKAFAQAYPHIKIDLWIDEVRRTADPAQWPHLQKYSLYDWVEEAGFFHKVYKRTYSPALYEESLAEAQAENYPIVVALAHLRPQFYARLAHQISPHGMVAGTRESFSLFKPHHYWSYRLLNASIRPYPPVEHHISAAYADWFQQLFGLDIPVAARYPFVDIPPRWTDAAKSQLEHWGFAARTGKLVFINPFAKSHKRCWPLERVTELIATMQRDPAWAGARFIINAMPQDLASVRQAVEQRGLRDTHMFSAVDNFFELPAMLAQCDLIISVETSIMHLANAVHVPVVALMRRKNPEWTPIDAAHSNVITVGRRNDWVKAITVNDVMRVIG